MNKLIIAAVLAWPSATAGAAPALLDKEPVKQPKDEVVSTVQRPDSQKILAELSSLRLSSKQEARINKAINKETKNFDSLMKEYEKTSAEEKKWRYKANDQRHELLKITQNVPNIIRDFLDDEQRQGYDEMLNSRAQPASREEPAMVEGMEGSDDFGAPAPVKKRKVLKKKRLPAAGEESLGEEAPGEVMVDKDQGARPAPALKKKVSKKRPAGKGRVPAPEEDLISEEAAGSKPAGKQPVEEEEDAGSYP